MQQFKNRFLSVWFEESVGIPCLQQRCNGFKCALCRIVNDARALLSLSSDWSHSVYKAFDPTTAVSARCGHDWRHALVGSPDPVVVIFYICEYAQPHVFIHLFTIIECTFCNAPLCEKHLQNQDRLLIGCLWSSRLIILFHTLRMKTELCVLSVSPVLTLYFVKYYFGLCENMIAISCS